MQLGDAGTFVDACAAARAAQREWARVPAPVRGRAIQQIGRLVEDNKEALAAPRHARDRQALRRVAGRGAGDHRHLRTSSSARAGASTARRCRRRCPTSSCSPSACRSASRRSSPRATSRSPSPPGTSCRRCCAATPSSGSRPSTRRRSPRRSAELFLHGGLPDGVLQPRARRRRGDLRRPRAGARRRAWSTRSASPARPRSAAEIGELAGRHLQSPCLELGGKNPMVVMPDADLDLAVEGALFSGFGTAGQRCTSLGTVIVARVGPRRVPRALRRGHRGAPPSATRPRTSSTGR